MIVHVCIPGPGVKETNLSSPWVKRLAKAALSSGWCKKFHLQQNTELLFSDFMALDFKSYGLENNTLPAMVDSLISSYILTNGTRESRDLTSGHTSQ